MKRLGQDFPEEQFIAGSTWRGEGWASGGRKVDWARAPSQAHYRELENNGCEFGSGKQCCSRDLWWNRKKNWARTQEQQLAYEAVKKKFVHYDYCSGDRKKDHKECQVN